MFLIFKKPLILVDKIKVTRHFIIKTSAIQQRGGSVKAWGYFAAAGLPIIEVNVNFVF